MRNVTLPMGTFLSAPSFVYLFPNPLLPSSHRHVDKQIDTEAMVPQYILIFFQYIALFKATSSSCPVLQAFLSIFLYNIHVFILTSQIRLL